MKTTSPEVATILGRALEIETPAGRAAYLQEACGEDARLRGEVEGLLSSLGRAGGFMGRPAPDALTSRTVGYEPVTEGPGTVIGPYKLLQQIGEGGFGVVYMAEQERPVRRMVALKIIKPGMDTAQVIARFESERQALALMDHPNIARVLDAGATGSGRPYFVMELVKGVPVTEFCDKNHLPADQRLKLFIDVCHAIQHAHHKGVIHRDVKPSNVMVTLHDGVPVVKVIDFGVAKATAQRLTERTLFTAYGQMIGTPAYMSPEQAEMSGLDIDTRSDVYSLGVLLYELLTGTTPLEGGQLRQAGYAEMQRLIREQAAPRPSTRLSSLGETATALAGNRGTDPKQLVRLLSGDLDWIVLRALEKDRNRRYGTPAGFADDVERFLRREAILARPPSAAYKLKKFLQRNRAAATAAAAVAAALLVGTAVATWQAVRATRLKSAAVAALHDARRARGAEAAQRQRAEAGEARALAAAAAEKTARETADARRQETDAVVEFFLHRMFMAARPLGEDGGLGRDVTLRRALEAVAPVLQDSFKKQPRIEARLRLALGISFLDLGEPKAAAEQFEAARALYTRELGPENRYTLWSVHDLANAYADLGRTEEALKLREQTLAVRKAALGPDDPDTLGTMSALSLSYCQAGRLVEALKLSEEVLALQRKKLGPDDADTVSDMHLVAGNLNALGRYAEAARLLEEAPAIEKGRRGPDRPAVFNMETDLANSYESLGRQADALKLREDVASRLRAVLGPDHPRTLTAMSNLANSYHNLGRHEEALKLRRETLDRQKARLGPDHPDTLLSMSNLANSLSALGRYAEAARLREETLALQRRKLGPDHPSTLLTLDNLANSYMYLGRHDESLKLRREVVGLRTAKLGAEHPDTLRSKSGLATEYHNVGRFADALEVLKDTLPLQKARLGPNHPETVHSMAVEADCLEKLGRGDEAVAAMDECIAHATGEGVEPYIVPTMMEIRLRHFEKSKDAAGCRRTAEMWEKLNRTDVESLYNAACYRAITSALLRREDGAAEQAERAVQLLRRAVAAGYHDAAHMREDKDLDALRERDDFKAVLSGIGT